MGETSGDATWAKTERGEGADASSAAEEGLVFRHRLADEPLHLVWLDQMHLALQSRELLTN